MKTNKLFLFLIVSVCLFSVHTPNLKAGHHSTPGQKVDDAIDYTKDKIKKAKNKAKDKVKDGLNKAKDKVRNKIKDDIDRLKNK